MRTGARALAVVTVSVLALSACANNGAKDDDKPQASQTTAPVTVTFGYEQEFQAYNSNTSDQNATLNNIVLNQVLRGFWYFDPKGGVARDTEFGTFEKTSDSPLTVKYTINPKAVWSDGQPIDCDDFILTWAGNSNAFPTGKKDDEGNDLYAFSTAGSTGYEDQEVPQCNDGDKTVTVVYKKPFADWAALYGSATIVPAHILEQRSGVSDIIAAVKNKDMDQLVKAGKFYNSGWILKPGELQPELTPSAGPYKLDQWEAGQSLTLKPNEKWWGTPPTSQTIVIRFIPQDQQAQALQNGEIQVMDPQPNPELLNQLKGIGSSVKVQNFDQYTFEHYDFNFKTDFKDRDLRLAFTKCLPRQTIIDNLIKPQNPNAKILQSRYFLPFQPEYAQIAPQIVGTDYDAVDIDGAKQILEQKGKTGMEVRIGYYTPNPRRTAEVQLIADSCGKAGFKIKDAGSDTFFGDGLPNGKFDVALFAWTGSPLVTTSNSTYVTRGGNNMGKYSNPQVDALIGQLNQELNRDKQVQLIVQIEKILWQDLATIPAFAFPAVAAWSANATNVVPNSSQSDITWNMNKWGLAAS